MGYPVILAYGLKDSHYVKEGELVAYTPEQAEAKRFRPPNAIAWSNNPIGWIYPPVAVVLESRRASLWEAAKARRSELENEPFEYDGKLFDADTVSQQRIASAVLLATLASSSSFAIEWTLANNTTAELGAGDLIGLGVTLGQRTANVFRVAAQVRQLIDNAETLTELESVAAHSFFVGDAKVTADSA
jgi:hypothetical protein